MKKQNQKDILNKFKQTHGDKYDYSKVEYKNARTKVCIICPEHGEFWQLPYNHINGQDCPLCSKIKFTNSASSTTEEFISKARKIHGDKYDYSKVEYINCETKVCIICPEHGEFWQLPSVHLSGTGCPDCGKIKASTSHTLTTEEFISKARKIHGDKYDYSKVEYIKMKEKVCIVCPKHGEFWQTAHSHLCNNGCPKCSTSKLENEIIDLLKANNIKYRHQYKFEWLKDINNLTVDFYIPDYNVVIECQGLQHFKASNFGSKKSDKNKLFETTIRHDKIKFNECKKHNIEILYFSNLNIDYPYMVYENKDELIDKILNNNK